MKMKGRSDRLGEWRAMGVGREARRQGLWWGQAARQTTAGVGRVLGCSQCWGGGG